MLKPLREYSTKADLVYKTLVEAITTNKLPPGTRLIVKDIAEQLSVSDIPVREALKILESTGLIETKPYIGSVVTTPSPEWIEEVFVMRAALESMAIRVSIPFLTEQDIQNIIAIDLEMKESAKTANHAEYASLNRRFHKTIMEKSPYPNLLSMIDELLIKSSYGQAIFGLKPMTVKTSDLEHDELIAVIKNRDVDRAEALTRDHRLRVGKELAEAMRKLSDKTNLEEVSKKQYV